MTDHEIANRCNRTAPGDWQRQNARRARIGWGLLGVFIACGAIVKLLSLF